VKKIEQDMITIMRECNQRGVSWEFIRDFASQQIQNKMVASLDTKTGAEIAAGEVDLGALTKEATKMPTRRRRKK
jgi:hypothetical protein